jgi:glutamyl/glutaminyl-tRNA synthetase
MHIQSPSLKNDKYYIEPDTVKEYLDEIPNITSEAFRDKHSGYFLNVYRSFIPEFDAITLEKTLKVTASELGVKAGVLVHPCRLALTGKTSGPSLYYLLEVLGKDKVMQRIERALGNAGFRG